MAASFTLVVATPYSLRYRYFYDGTGGAGSGVATRTQAQMIADCATATAFSTPKGPNPLKAFLENITDDGTWNLIDLDPRISLTTNVTNPGPNFLAVSSDIETVGAIPPLTRQLRTSSKDGEANVADVEIRFHHTLDR